MIDILIIAQLGQVLCAKVIILMSSIQEWFRPSVIFLTKCTFLGQAHQVNYVPTICVMYSSA